MMMFEKNIPVTTSVRDRRSSSPLAPFRSPRQRPMARSSSTSCAACQKKRYGEMVVPRIPTNTERKDRLHSMRGTNVDCSTAPQSACAKNAVTT